ncbi:hypothetical protein RYX36_023191 [Vicia faba]
MNFLKLFLVALAPVLNTLFIAVIGAVLALDNIGILKKNTKKHLNIVVHAIKYSSKIYYWDNSCMDSC